MRKDDAQFPDLVLDELAKRLVEEYMVRIESCSSYSSEVAAN